MSVCVSLHKCFFPPKVSQKLLHLRILKFGTNIGYDLLYCVRENMHPHVYHSLYLTIFSFSPVEFFATDFSAPMRASILEFCIHPQRVEIKSVKEKHNAEIYFAFFFPFLHLSVQCNA